MDLDKVTHPEHPVISVNPSAPPLPPPPYSENDAENGVGQFTTPQRAATATFNHPTTIMPAQTYQPMGPLGWLYQKRREGKKCPAIVCVPYMFFWFIILPIVFFGLLIYSWIQWNSD